MLFRIPHALKNSGTGTKSIICSSLKRFSQQDFSSKIKIDRNLLYPFSQSLTSKALNALRETSPLPSDVFLIDKLTATDYSETYRAYDFDRKAFVAQKNIHLGSPASWNQVNLILRQQQQSSPLFARTLSINYDEEAQNMKITSELQNTLLKDYSLYMKDHQSSWLKERIRFYAMQIIQQLDTLKQLGIELEGEKAPIDPQKFFIAKSFQVLKLYDLSDFTVSEAATSQIDQNELLEIAKKTLMKVIDMKGESKDMNEISLIFQKIEAEMTQKGTLTQPLSDFMKNSESLRDNGYDQFILDKLLQTAITKDSGLHLNISETNKTIANPEIGRDLRDIYIKHADAYSSKGDFKSAIECYEKAMETEANLGKIQRRGKSDASTGGFLSDESIYAIAKPKSGLKIVKNFGINVIMMVFEIFLMFFTVILCMVLLAGVFGLFAWGSSQLFGPENDESTGVDEKEK